MFLNDHQVRRAAILGTGFIIENREDYLDAVFAWNRDFIIERGRIWKQYVREPGTRKPYGLVIVYKKGDKVYVSGSVLHKGDKWDRELALFYAANRADPAVVDLESGTFNPDKLPRTCFEVAAALVDEYIAKN